MAPQRARTTICFAERGVAQVDHGTVPRLTVFEHVPGARVFSDLFPDYRLPNGMKAFCYYDAGACLPFLWHWGLLHIQPASLEAVLSFSGWYGCTPGGMP